MRMLAMAGARTRLFGAFRIGMLFLALGVLPNTVIGAESQGKCELRQYGELEVVVQDGPTVAVTLNGRQGYMRVSTGNAFSHIYENVATDMNLVRHRIPPIVREGDKTLDRVALYDTLVLGNARFGKGSLLISPARNRPPEGAPPDQILGTLGMDILAANDVELDFRHRKIRIFAHTQCSPGPVYWATAFAALPFKSDEVGSLYFFMELDGKRIRAGLDSTSKNARLMSDISKALYGFDENTPELDHAIEADGEPISSYTAMKITAPGMTVVNATVRVQPRNKNSPCKPELHLPGKAAGYSGCAGLSPLSLGWTSLEKLRVFIATSQKMLYFTAAEN